MTNPRTTTPVRRLLAVAAAGLVLTAGACSASSDTKADTKSEAGSTTRPAAGATTTTSDRRSGTEAASAGSKPTKKEILATTDGQQPADPNDGTPVPLRLDITAVKRLSGDTVEVTFDLTNTSDASADTTFKPYDTMSDPAVGTVSYDVGGVALLDRPQDKKYLTLYDTGDVCLCSDVSELELAGGKTVSLYADVTSPPKATSTVDFTLPGFPPVTGLEIR